ncbi:hypothetical protein GCM10008949_38850 [Deinococcus humi]|nr:hypothetical protein GCM10008949_38850 [Deinococcus humi]
MTGCASRSRLARQSLLVAGAKHTIRKGSGLIAVIAEAAELDLGRFLPASTPQALE